ncbi:MAG: Peptidase Ste24p [Novosphingobium sp.]|nr:Peptidase Ste24p [Novosphingobium sp.]
MDFDEQERTLRDAPAVLHDLRLTQFVHAVLCRTVGEDRCASARVFIVQDGEMNASMSPNGLMIVQTGLLARLHSEAELAAILGHEFAHFELRHSLQKFRARRTGSDLSAWIGLAGAATNTGVVYAQNNIVVSFFSFSRAQETEADLLSAKYIRASSYRLRASHVWQRALDEANEFRKERSLRKVRRVVPGLTDTHPTDLQRIAYHIKLEQEAGEVGEEGVATYRAATAPVLRTLFDSLIKGNQFSAVDYVIRSRGDAVGWDGQLYYVQAENYRQRANPRDLVTARGLFQHAVSFPDAPAESWRGLGLCAMRLGETDAGRTALAEYLKRLPDARDAASIKLLLEN